MRMDEGKKVVDRGRLLLFCKELNLNSGMVKKCSSMDLGTGEYISTKLAVAKFIIDNIYYTLLLSILLPRV